MIPANFDYEAPRTLTDALTLLQSREDAKILAGGWLIAVQKQMASIRPATRSSRPLLSEAPVLA